MNSNNKQKQSVDIFPANSGSEESANIAANSSSVDVIVDDVISDKTVEQSTLDEKILTDNETIPLTEEKIKNENNNDSDSVFGIKINDDVSTKKNSKYKIKTKNATRDIALIGLFTALISVGAFIQIPLPVIPFTMQVFFVLLGAQFLGVKRATCAAFLYLALGLIGVPIFTKGGGWSYIFQPSFGFIIGFVVSAFFVAIIVKFVDKSPYRIIKKTREIYYFLAGIVGIIIFYAFGMVYFYFLKDLYFKTPIPFYNLFAILFLPTIFGDIISLVASSIIAGRLRKVIRI